MFKHVVRSTAIALLSYGMLYFIRRVGYAHPPAPLETAPFPFRSLPFPAAKREGEFVGARTHEDAALSNSDCWHPTTACCCCCCCFCCFWWCGGAGGGGASRKHWWCADRLIEWPPRPFRLIVSSLFVPLHNAPAPFHLVCSAPRFVTLLISFHHHPGDQSDCPLPEQHGGGVP